MAAGATQSLGPDTCKDAPKDAARWVARELPGREAALALRLAVASW